MRLTTAVLVTMSLSCGPDPAGTPSVDGPPAPVADAPAGGNADAPGCAEVGYEAEQSPAALLVVLDRSSSMAENNKWTFAAQAIVAALDNDVFDPLHVGLYAAPSGTVTGPSCIFGFPVPCQAPPFPQVDLALAGTMKSTDASGVRRTIRNWLTANSPDTGIGDGSPLYNALQAAIGAIRLWPEDGKRIILVVTDGSISCAQFSMRPGFGDCNGCDHDWEHPQNIVDLLAEANSDPSQPIESFIVGVPGADTYDATACNYPPYRMRLALSAMAAAGSPDHISPTCDGRTFTQTGADPTESCHFDMTTPGGFSATALADAINYVRGQTLGCVFDLPVPGGGGTIDLDRVNVSYTADGVEVDLARRADPSNPCTDVGCWDYTPDNKVELLGLACNDIKTATSVSVRIVTGCDTIIQ